MIVNHDELRNEMNVSGYRIEKQIGKGGMAMVYLAIQESLGRPVALKIMNPMFSDTKEFSERFLDEGRILASLNHSHIITSHDVGICNSRHFISMEFVDGGDLGDKIKQGVSPETALEYAQNIAGSLQVAHAAHIVHRDVKPANILFRRDGTLLLTDFGIAKQLASAKGLTVTGSMLGSPHYLSPEQAQGKAVDGRADIYSLGIMLYEMLLGTRPFDGDSDVDIAIKHITQTLARLPNELAVYQNLLDSMTARNPDERFPSASSLLEALKEFRSTGRWSGEIVQIQDESTPPLIETSHACAKLSIPKSDDVPLDVDSGDTVKMSVNELADTIKGPAVTETSADNENPEHVKPTRHSKTGLILVAASIMVILAGVVILSSPVQREDANNQNRDEQVVTVDRVKMEDEAEKRRLRQRQQQISQLLQKAETALGKDHLTSPTGDNAYDYYQQVLTLNLDNIDAPLGFGKIADRYLVLAISAERDWDYEKARIHVERGLMVKSDHIGLLEKQYELETTKGDVTTKTKNVFTGVKKLFD